MTKKTYLFKRLIAFLLVIAMSVPHVVFASEYPVGYLHDANEYLTEYQWDDLDLLEEIEPLGYYLDEFEMFSMGDQFVLEEYLGMDIDNPLAEPPPEVIEELLRMLESRALEEPLLLPEIYEEPFYLLESFKESIESIEPLEIFEDIYDEFLYFQEDYWPQNFYIYDMDELANLGGDAIDPMIAPLSVSSIHQGVVVRPFDLHLNENESVCLNTGASQFRMNVINLPGRGGFGLNLDLLYNSSSANLRRSMRGITNTSQSFNITFAQNNPDGLGVGWMFDLPHVSNGALYVPGRGSFVLNGLQFRDHTLLDKRLFDDTSFTSGTLQSSRRLTFQNGTSYFFSGGRVIGMVDRFGNTIRFEYANVPQFGNQQHLSRIVDTNGLIISFQYQASGNNRTITVTGPDNSTYTINMSLITGHNVFQLEYVNIKHF